ncbi:MAG: DinB family protein [Fibrobacteria bacterium]
MLEKSLAHMHWANARIHEWLKPGRASAEEHAKLASHILNAEKVWISRAKSIPSDPHAFTLRSLDEMSALNDANHAGFLDLLKKDIARPIPYRMFSGSPGSTSIEDMILHVFTHGFHHAGQMAALASRNGEKFPDVSYIGFTRSR